VSDDDRGGSVLYGRIEDLSWVNQGLIEGADADDVGMDNPVGTIEGEGEEVFPLEIPVCLEVLIGTVGMGDDGIVSDLIVQRAVLPDAASAAPVSIAPCRSAPHLRRPVPTGAL